MPLKGAPMWFFGAFFLIIALHTSSADEVPSFIVQDVEVSTEDTVHPVYLMGLGDMPSEHVGRVHILGWSRLQHVDKFHHTFRVKIDVPSYAELSLDSKVSVCFDQNPLRDLGECGNGSWRFLDKAGSWTGSMSPFEGKYVDIWVTKSFSSPTVNISVQDEKSAFRLVFLGLGVIFLVMAPIVSGWVPFYYGSAMTLGIIMVVLVILYQGMKLLPTGRKSSLYIMVYGSLAGLGTVLLRYISGVLSTILWEMGLSEDMYTPVAALAGVGVALLGAWLGYMGVRKLVIAEDGDIDEGIAEFVKWSLRILGSFFLLQSSSDYIFMAIALFGGIVVSWILLNVRVSLVDVWENVQDFWRSEREVPISSTKKKKKSYMMTQAQTDALRRLPGTEALIIDKKGLVNQPVDAGSQMKSSFKPGEVFPSTFHQSSPGYKPSSKQEYVATAIDYSNRAVDHLVHSKEFAEWRHKNQHRVVVEPVEHREERLVEEIGLTPFLEEATPSGFLGFKRR